MPEKLPKVVALRDGAVPPKGYVIALINHPLAPGVHAVKPKSKCQECWGKGMSRADGVVKTCSCVLARIDRYVRSGGA